MLQYLVFEHMEKNLLEEMEHWPQVSCRSSHIMIFILACTVPFQGVETEVVKMYVHQLLSAIAFCHKHDVVHRGMFVVLCTTCTNSLTLPILLYDALCPF